MRVAVLSNVTVDLLATQLRKSFEVYLSPGFNTWQQEMLNHNSGLSAFSPEAVVILLHAGAYPQTWDSLADAKTAIDEWHVTIGSYVEQNPGLPVFVSSLDVPERCCSWGSAPRFAKGMEQRFEDGIGRLHDDGNTIYILPVREEMERLGRTSFYSQKMWYMGSMPWSSKGLRQIATVASRYLESVYRAPKKCLAVDLDNTLWGGVIGEDGVEGILLSENKEGARFKDAQRILKRMRKQGVMLAIVSKNNPEDAELAFSHPHMVLGHEDFVDEEIGWDPKPVGVERIAKELNIGIDAIVFLDDNPAEREQMHTACPDVTVAEFPQDTSMLPQVIEQIYYDYFFSLEVTAEDMHKTEMYRSETMRKSERKSAASLRDYLLNLDMSIDVHRLREDEIVRAVQLAGKTNQFNVTTIRYAREEIETLVNADDADVICAHVADKYGDQGLVALIVLRYEDGIARIESFLMSCRVMGRDVERELMAQVKKLLDARGTTAVLATYAKTQKNVPVEGLFDQLGFHRKSELARETGDEYSYEASTQDLPSSTGFFEIIGGGLT